MNQPKRRKLNKRIALATALAGIAGLTLIRPDVPNAVLPPDYITVGETYDGYTHGVSLDTPYLHLNTPSLDDDSSPDSSGWLAVWQHATDQGRQILVYDARNNHLIQITDGEADHINPQTDGRYVVWQGKEQGKWNVYLYDYENPDFGTVKISSASPAIRPKISDGTVVWQQWVGNNWEIFVWSGGRTAALTTNTKPDFEPDIFHSMVVWTETNPGPLNHVLVHDLKTGNESFLDTESKGQIRPTFSRDGTLQWFAFEDEGYVKREYNFLTDLDTQEVIKAAAEPAVESAPAEPVPEPVIEPVEAPSHTVPIVEEPTTTEPTPTTTESTPTTTESTP